MPTGIADITVRVSELPEFRELLRVGFALDEAVAEFGLHDPDSIREAYQRFHDVLHGFLKPHG